jgi:hypothetical protein
MKLIQGGGGLPEYLERLKGGTFSNLIEPTEPTVEHLQRAVRELDFEIEKQKSDIGQRQRHPPGRRPPHRAPPRK